MRSSAVMRSSKGAQKSSAPSLLLNVYYPVPFGECSLRVKIHSCFVMALAMFCGPRVVAQNAAPGPCSLIVNVMDSRGNPIRDLQKDNFRVEVDKHPISISTTGYQLLPRRVVIVLDLSGSMTARENPHKWEVARTAIQTFLTLTPPQMPVALLAFSGKTLATFGFDRDRASMLSWLNKADDQTHGVARPTALYDGLLEGLKLLEPHQEGDSIYDVITDGKDNSSVTGSPERLKEALLKNRVRLFTFLLSERFTEESRIENAIMSTANETGGFVLGRAAESGSIGTALSK
jgi:von Willebrand factor type A domain